MSWENTVEENSRAEDLGPLSSHPKNMKQLEWDQ